ncbi:MAG: hypothetical protein R3315_02035 [Woeseiaceae bacterium]|nr:hypothetical protein [Woeseiaceae bacterium]
MPDPARDLDIIGARGVPDSALVPLVTKQPTKLFFRHEAPGNSLNLYWYYTDQFASA